MNCSCYLYGSFDNSYVQYPDDNTRLIFEKGIAYCDRESQMIIHREERQMYYSFVQKLANQWPSYVGVTVVLSELFVTDVEGIYTLLNNAITSLAVSGEILDFGNGGIISKVKSLSKRSAEMSALFKELMYNMNRMNGALEKLPPIRYGINKDTYIRTNLGNNEQLLEQSLNYGFLIISKEDLKESMSDVQKILKPLDKKTTVNKWISRYVLLTAKDKIIILLLITVFILLTIIILR